ncbi:MAG: DUF3488 domain-containing protein, partial [Myxococcota bacterium]|nr:DUF3488 domain-containing protein [Myxococcota bacterium]
GALISAWFYDAPLQRVDAQERWWTVGTIGALFILSVLAWVTDNYLLYAIYFALVMVVTRLFQSRGSRDAFQLYGLSFVAMIAGAVINPTLSFIFAFIPYVVVLVWGLIVLHLQRDIEGLQEEQRELGERPADLAWRARNLITPGFLSGSSLLALGIFATSLVIFFFFPRLGFGFFFSQGRQTQSISGFSDRIELGHFGTIKDNMRVVMRVELPDDPMADDHILRMRGISFDHYDGRIWSKTTTRTMDLPRENVGTWRVVHPGEEARERENRKVLRQDVYLEPLEMEQRMVFGQPRVLRLSIDNPELDRLRRHPVRFYQDAGGDVSTRVPDDVALRYHVESAPERTEAPPRSGELTIPRTISRLYLQLPTGVDPAVEALARQITSGVTGPLEQ